MYTHFQNLHFITYNSGKHVLYHNLPLNTNSYSNRTWRHSPLNSYRRSFRDTLLTDSMEVVHDVGPDVRDVPHGLEGEPTVSVARGLVYVGLVGEGEVVGQCRQEHLDADTEVLKHQWAVGQFISDHSSFGMY